MHSCLYSYSHVFILTSMPLQSDMTFHMTYPFLTYFIFSPAQSAPNDSRSHTKESRSCSHHLVLGEAILDSKIDLQNVDIQSFKCIHLKLDGLNSASSCQWTADRADRPGRFCGMSKSHCYTPSPYFVQPDEDTIRGECCEPRSLTGVAGLWAQKVLALSSILWVLAPV